MNIYFACSITGGRQDELVYQKLVAALQSNGHHVPTALLASPDVMPLEGVVSAEANPNGSMDNIAGICNERRNVFGMMPHPERASEEILGSSAGRRIFESIVGNAKG